MTTNLLRRLTILLGFFISLILLLLLTSTSLKASADGVEYSAHVQNLGWQDYTANGATAGTEGQGLQLEAIKVRLTNPNDLGVEYRTHVSNIGWQDYVADDQISGTEGRNLQLEALSIRLVGNDSPNYNIFYRVHAQDHGWLGWAKNGENAGTQGLNKRLEAVQILLLPVTETGPEQSLAFVEKDPNAPDQNSPLHYKTYIAGSGWKKFVNNGAETGSGDINAIEAIQIGLSDDNYKNGGIIYKKLGGAGWTPWLNNDQVLGSPGDPLQAIRIKLTDKLNYLYDISYRVHSPNIGWSNWAKNGAAAGSEGYGRAISLIQIILTPKGEGPAADNIAFSQTPWYWPLTGIRGLSTTFGPQGGSHHDGIDVPAPSGTPIHSAKAGTVRKMEYIDGINHLTLYGGFGNCVVVENDSGEICYYAHMSRFNTAVGKHVSAGEVIGFVGTTGNSLGNHLHFEVYDSRDELVDPMSFY